MRKAIALSIALLSAFLVYVPHALCYAASNADTLRPASRVSEVTVFTSGAQVTRQVALDLGRGTHCVLVQGLPLKLDPSSLQVDGPDACTVLSVKHLPDVRAGIKKSDAYKDIEKEIHTQRRHLKALKQESDVYDQEEDILLDNSHLGGSESGVGIEEIRQAADFYRSRLNEIRKAKMDLADQSEEILERIKELQSDLGVYEAARHQLSSEALITFQCHAPTADSLALSYYCSAAGWTPGYDLRMSDVQSPLLLGYNADVFQSTGEDWEQVRLTLSTGNPRLSSEKPLLEEWRIGRRHPARQVESTDGTGELRGMCVDAETGEPLPFVNIVLKRDGQTVTGTTTDFDGIYRIKPLSAASYDVEVSYIGYHSMRIVALPISSSKITFQDVELEAAVQLAEMEIVPYSIPLIDRDGGSSGGTVSMGGGVPKSGIATMPVRTGGVPASMSGSRDRDFYPVDGMGVAGSRHYPDDQSRIAAAVEAHLQGALRDNVVHHEYLIDVPFSVRSDGRDYQLRMKEVDVPARYVYHLIPKLDTDAFLTAGIAGWTALNLLPGKAAVYHRGTFTGYTRIDPDYTGDTLHVSLGRDRSIVVQRKGRQEVNDRRLVGNSVRETQIWDLDVRNAHDSPVKVVLYDQYPVSELKSVQVNLAHHSGATVDEQTGALRWEFDLEGDGRAQRSFSYELKYPQGSVTMVR